MDITAQLARAILESHADAILVADREGVICFWNPGAARIFGFGAEEAIGHSLDLIIPEPLRARHWEGYKRVMVSGETRYGSGDVLSVPALTKAGLRISVEFTIIILREDNDAVIGMAAILRDVSAR